MTIPQSALRALALALVSFKGAMALPEGIQRRTPLSPAYDLFSVALPIPPIKAPLFSLTNPFNGKEIDYYEIEIKPFQHQIFPDLEPADFVGYDGMSPGPTFYQEKGRESVVRFVNKATVESSIHLHGSFSRAPWDGWAEDVTQPGEYKDYFYPNEQAGRFSWYHDHAMHETAENAYNGQAGGYILHDPDEDALGLPSGYGEYDIPLILTSKQYNADGTLFSTKGELNSLWGDVIQVVSTQSL
jgi:bilirubin oxidase